MLNTANIYIDLLNKIKESGGAVPPELVKEVEALNVTVNGDETTEPPTVGLVDIVGDLGDVVEDLDIDINGDDTTEPPTHGLKYRVEALESDIIRITKTLNNEAISNAWGSLFTSGKITVDLTGYSNYDVVSTSLLPSTESAILVPYRVTSTSFECYLARVAASTLSGDIVLLLKKKTS